MAMASSTAKPRVYAERKSTARVRDEGPGVCFEVYIETNSNQLTAVQAMYRQFKSLPGGKRSTLRRIAPLTFISIHFLCTFIRT